jgi:chromosome segregation ATPase
MDFEQIIKRLDWLDEEHRKDKSNIDTLLQRIESLEGQLKVANKKIKDLNADISQYSTVPARIEQHDTALAQQRIELLKYIDTKDKKSQDLIQEVEKRYDTQISGVTKSLIDVRKIKDPITEIRRDLKNHTDEETRQSKILVEWENRMREMVKTVEDVQRAQKATEEPRRQESKRIADLQGELSAARKRLDESRMKIDLFFDNIRRIETRLNEILASEAERSQAQTAFIETQSRLHIERDHEWKQWESSLDTIQKQSETMAQYLQDWSATQRLVKQAQDTYEGIVQKFERRINEISEMQRLAEDRFRQEWVTFKADDQKRWTSFTLSQDESHKDSRSGIVKLDERITSLEDLTQVLQDILEQTKDTNQQFFQGVLAQIHELLTAYERILSVR